MFAQLIDITRDALTLTLEVVLDGAREACVGQPVGRERLDGHQPAEDLVLALRAALEELQAPADRIFDGLVVAALEMQQRHVLDRAPVATVDRRAIDEEERGCDRPALALGKDHRYVSRQRSAHSQEEL